MHHGEFLPLLETKIRDLRQVRGDDPATMDNAGDPLPPTPKPGQKREEQ